MKSISINLDSERSAKLQKLSDSTSGHTSQIELAGLMFSVKERKISASAIAIGLLNAAIDNAHAQLPE
jgi:predicted transcriptional regulator